jgi:hypothetical protein
MCEGNIVKDPKRVRCRDVWIVFIRITVEHDEHDNENPLS